MRNLVFLLAFFSTISCVSKGPATNNQEEIYKSWVVSRCLSYVFPEYKQDALNTASAYLEQSSLPVESFIESEELIQEFINKNYAGSIPSGFNTKKCIDLFNSDELQKLYIKQL